MKTIVQLFLLINIHVSQTESQEYEISAMPTFVFIRSSKELERIRGANIDAIETALNKYAKETSAFSGEGHSMLETNAESTSTTVPIVESDRDRLEKAARERFSNVEDGEKLTALRLRLPDLAIPITIRLSVNQTLNDVRHLICETIPMFDETPFEFFEPPATKIQLDDECKTLEEAKLTNSALTIRKI